jgi:hypothetical protein
MQNTEAQTEPGCLDRSVTRRQDRSTSPKGRSGGRRGRAREEMARRGGPRSTKRPPKSRRAMTLEAAAMEYVWLWDRRHGRSVEAIAAREGVSAARVRFGLARARAQEKGVITTRTVRAPRLVPLFPIGAYTPQSSCGHRRAIEAGSALCCMVCHQSGMDQHPALWRDPRSEPAPEPKPAPPPVPLDTQRETRKKRREREFGARP